MELNSIGFFQFDNLVQSRIPLVLIMLDEVDLKPWYNSLVRMHLENVTMVCKPEEALTKLKTKGIPFEFAIIVLDLDGKASPSVTAQLEKSGFINCYFVRGGFNGLLQERKMI